MRANGDAYRARTLVGADGEGGFRFGAARAAPPSGPSAPQAQNEITLILDGRTYRSSDPGLSADVRALMAEDEARQHWPFRYGAVIPTALSSDEAGEWSELPGGELVWRLALEQTCRVLLITTQAVE